VTTRDVGHTSASSERWIAIDASRGVAMVFVCLSHFATGYFASIGHPERQEFTDRISMLASPAFMLISGSMLGLLSATRSTERFARVRDKFMDRGLFLIFVAHLLIVIAHLPLRDGPRAWMRWGFITDTIGVCLLVGPSIVRRLPARARLAFAGAMYTAGWWLVRAWHPTVLAMRFLKDSILGPMGTSTRLYNFPVLPWLAVYLAGTALGGAMAKRRARGESSVHLVVGVGSAATAIATTCIAVAATTLPSALIPTGDIFTQLSDLASPFQKLPPGPLYLLGYGGLALVMMGALMWAEERALATRTLRAISLVGRASLLVFILQYYVNFVFVPLLHLPDTPWWPVFFVGSLAAIYLMTAAWMVAGLNRLITVGYPFARARATHGVPSGAQHHASELPTVGA
jgi:uncharacterized membrane protein